MPALLHANDRSGEFPESYYAASVTAPPKEPALQGHRKADVAIIGAGFTGLSAAYALAKRGYDVVILEAHRAGFGASGRNGGQLGSGQRVEQPELEQTYGRDAAHAMWGIAQASKALVLQICADEAISCDLKPGIAHVNHRARYDRETAELVDHMAKHYSYEMRYLPPDQCRDLVKSPKYSAGVLDETSYHLHPLKLALGLAGAAKRAGATIYETSEVTAIDQSAKTIKTANGSVSADTIILAGNGYLERLSNAVAQKVMPINNFILATQPLSPAQADSILGQDIAVADSKFVVNYFRLSADRRLLFGGRESYGYRFPRDIKTFVARAMLEIYPQMKGVRLDYGWGGTLAITMPRLPYLAQVQSGIWNASGYSGHGVGMATMSGKIIADAIAGQTEQFDVMSKIKLAKFPGGPKLKHPLLVAAMLWYGLRDKV